MTDGTSQGLFIVVAIVIFGIFTLMAYILFEDTLSPALASMFTEATEQATKNLNSSNDSVLITPIWERAISNNNSQYPLLNEKLSENGYTYTRLTSKSDASIKMLSLNMPFYGSDFSEKELKGKKVKISLNYRTNRIGNTIIFSYIHSDMGELTDSNRKPLVSFEIKDTSWYTVSKVVDFPHDIKDGHYGYLFVHGGTLGDSYFDIKEVRFELLD